MNLIRLTSPQLVKKIFHPWKITGYRLINHFHKWSDLFFLWDFEYKPGRDPVAPMFCVWVKIWHSVPFLLIASEGNDPCSPYPCGPNTDCMVSPLGVAVCRCKSGYFPKPDTITGCGHQCDDDDDCSNSQNCANGRCVNICEEGICGVNALCEPRNRRAICRCPSGYSGDPFTRCSAGQTGKTKA